MNFHSCEKQMFKSFGCTEIRKDSEWTKTSRNEVMQPTASNNDSRQIFPYHVHKEADFENILLTEEILFTWAFPKWVSLFKYFQEFKVAYQ